MISILCIISSKGDMLCIEKYRQDVSQEQLEELISILVRNKSGLLLPYIKQKGIQGHYIRRDKLIYLAVTKCEISSFLAIHFLESFHAVLKNFCGSVTDYAIKKNIILVHELMTECVECGYIQTTNTEQLRTKVYTDPVISRTAGKTEARKHGPFGLERVSVPGSAADRPLVKSRSHQDLKQNEVFIDVIEKLTVHLGKDGSLLRFYLSGSVQLKSFITISHSLTIGLNEELHLGNQEKKEEAYVSGVHLDQYFFHNCVESSNFSKNHSFIIRPLQGEIEVMNYQVESLAPAQLPFRLVTAVEESTTNRDCNLTLKLCCHIPSNAEVLNLIVHIPVSSATKSFMQQFSLSDNTAEFISKERKIVWKIKRLPGSSESVAKFKLIDALQCPANRLELGPVALEFEVSNFVCSGLAIKFLKAEEPSRKPIQVHRWVRYVTLGDSYMFKL